MKKPAIVMVIGGISIALVVAAIWLALRKPSQSLVIFAEEHSVDDLSGGSVNVPIVVFYPDGEAVSIFIFKKKEKFYYLQIESRYRHYWIYESGVDIKSVDDVREALKLLTYDGHRLVRVGDHVLSAELWRDSSDNGGAIIFREDGTSVAFFWYELQISDAYNILTKLKRIE